MEEDLKNLLHSCEPSEAPPPSEQWLRVFAEQMAMLSQHFRAEMDAVGILGYRKGLRDLSEKELELAVDYAIAHHVGFIPVSGELREYLSKARLGLPVKKAEDCQWCFGSGWYHERGWPEAKRCHHRERPTGERLGMGR